MLAPSGEDAMVRFPVNDGATDVPVGTTVMMVVFAIVVFIGIGSWVTFVGITVVVTFAGYVVAVVRLISVSVGTVVVEFVMFSLLAATGVMISAIVTRRMNCARVFFTIRSPL